MSGVDGKVVIVTGAGQGIGRAHALEFAAHGARVVVNDFGQDADGKTPLANAVVQEILGAGGIAVESHHMVGDVAESQALVQHAVDEFGTLDVIVNNAGILRDASAHKMGIEQWRDVMRVHLDGAFLLTRAALPIFRENAYGRLLYTTSVSGLMGNFGQSNYAAAKLGVVGLMKTIALEGAKHNITAHALSPIASTHMNEAIMDASVRAKYDPQYVARLAVFLASEECRDTGYIIHAAGGQYTRIQFASGPDFRFQHVPTVEELHSVFDEIVGADGPNDGLLELELGL